jgi:hypothetical protein
VAAGGGEGVASAVVLVGGDDSATNIGVKAGVDSSGASCGGDGVAIGAVSAGVDGGVVDDVVARAGMCAGDVDMVAGDVVEDTAGTRRGGT